MTRHRPRLARGPGLNGKDPATTQERQEELEGVLVGEVTFFGMVHHIKGNRSNHKGLVLGYLFHPPSQISSSSMTTEEVEDVEGRSLSRKATSGILQTGTVNPAQRRCFSSSACNCRTRSTGSCHSSNKGVVVCLRRAPDGA